MADLQCVFSSFDNINKDLENYLSYDNEQNTKILGFLQDVFKYNKKDEISGKKTIVECPLGQLETDAGDNELIWQQIQLQNEALLTQTDKKLKKLLKDKDLCSLSEKNWENDKIINDDVINNIDDDNEEDNESVDDNNIDDDNTDDDIENDDNFTNKSKHNTGKLSYKKPSVVDDRFFKLSEMEEFLEIQEKQGDINMEDSDEEDYDLFQEYKSNELTDKLSSSGPHKQNDDSEYMYADFFDMPTDVSNMAVKGNDEISKTQFEEDEIDDEEEEEQEEEEEEEEEEEQEEGHDEVMKQDNNINKSTHEKQQERLQKKISQLEDSNMASKPWQLGGETTASVRPSNSLLEEMLYFDHTTAATPVMTEETTLELEDIIKQRIKDQTWDDVERKEKPVKERYEYVKNKPLNQEKSKMSLSEIYEKEYLAQVGPVVEKKNEDHEEIEKMMTKLFAKLDALSNYHFTPKPPRSDVTIIANVGSVTIEESTPVNVSDAKLLAPEEIFEKQKQELKSATEETKEDRKHKRRIKKKKQGLAAKKREEKMARKQGLGNKYTKEKVKKKKKDNVEQEETKSLTSSSAFFAKLQDSVQNEIHEKKTVANKKKKAAMEPAKIKL